MPVQCVMYRAPFSPRYPIHRGWGGKMSGGRLVEEGSERETSRLPLIKAVT